MKFEKFAASIDGAVTGSGTDSEGEFRVQGCVDNTGAFVFIKQYVGKHALSY